VLEVDVPEALHHPEALEDAPLDGRDPAAVALGVDHGRGGDHVHVVRAAAHGGAPRAQPDVAGERPAVGRAPPDIVTV
jgi:hypothetical protein